MTIGRIINQSLNTVQPNLRKADTVNAAYDKAKPALEKDLLKKPEAMKAYKNFSGSADYQALSTEARLDMIRAARNLGPAKETFTNLSILASSSGYRNLNATERRAVEKNFSKDPAKMGQTVKAYREILSDRAFAHARPQTRMHVLGKPDHYSKLTMNSLLRSEAGWVPEKAEFNAWGRQYVDAMANDLPPRRAALLFRPSDKKATEIRRKAYSDVIKQAGDHRDRVMSRWYEKAESGRNETVGEAYARVAGEAGGRWQDTLLRLRILEGRSQRRWLGISFEDRDPKWAY